METSAPGSPVAIAKHAHVPFVEILNMRLAEDSSGQRQEADKGGGTVKKPFLRRGEGVAKRVNAPRLKKDAEMKKEERKQQRRKVEGRKSMVLFFWFFCAVAVTVLYLLFLFLLIVFCFISCCCSFSPSCLVR